VRPDGTHCNHHSHFGKQQNGEVIVHNSEHTWNGFKFNGLPYWLYRLTESKDPRITEKNLLPSPILTTKNIIPIIFSVMATSLFLKEIDEKLRLLLIVCCFMGTANAGTATPSTSIIVYTPIQLLSGVAPF
jgi:hypothetical protein